MEEIDKTLRGIMHEHFHPARLRYVFNGRLTEDDIIIQALVECCKYAHDMVSEKKSLRAHMDSDMEDSDSEDPDSKRMKIQRSNDRILPYRQAQYELLKSSGWTYDELLPPDMSSIEKKLGGYQYNRFQYWEIKNVRSMDLVWHIVNRSITRKNFTSYRIEEDAKQYLNLIQELKQKETPLFGALALFVLEWKYSFEFMYAVAARMEEMKLTSIPDIKRKAPLFCGIVTTSTDLPFNDAAAGYHLTFESRMVVQRRKLIDDFLTETSIAEEGGQLHRFLEGLIVTTALVLNSTYDGIPLREWFVKNSNEEDWSSVFAEYDVYQVLAEEKEWTKNRVRYIKNIYSESTIEYHFP